MAGIILIGLAIWFTRRYIRNHPEKMEQFRQWKQRKSAEYNSPENVERRRVAAANRRAAIAQRKSASIANQKAEIQKDLAKASRRGSRGFIARNTFSRHSTKVNQRRANALSNRLDAIQNEEIISLLKQQKGS